MKASTDEDRVRIARAAVADLDRVCELSPQMAFVSKIEITRAAYAAGDRRRAASVARELLDTALSHRQTWYYGNAIFIANNVLGHIALDADDREGARDYLLAASATPGSPQLDSFGPELDLAQRLLDLGERDVVIAFFDAVARFSMHSEMLAGWKQRVLDGETFELDRMGALTELAMAKRAPHRS